MDEINIKANQIADILQHLSIKDAFEALETAKMIYQSIPVIFEEKPAK